MPHGGAPVWGAGFLADADSFSVQPDLGFKGHPISPLTWLVQIKSASRRSLARARYHWKLLELCPHSATVRQHRKASMLIIVCADLAIPTIAWSGNTWQIFIHVKGLLGYFAMLFSPWETHQSTDYTCFLLSYTRSFQNRLSSPPCFWGTYMVELLCATYTIYQFISTHIAWGPLSPAPSKCFQHCQKEYGKLCVYLLYLPTAMLWSFDWDQPRLA